MSIVTTDAASSIATRWATLRAQARKRGLSVKRIAALAGVPTRTVNDMFQDDWTCRTLENLTRLERAIEQAIGEEAA